MNFKFALAALFTLSFAFIEAQVTSNYIQVNRTEPIRIKLSTCQVVIANRKLINILSTQTVVSTAIVYEFLGIPFARPPLGSLRFQFPSNLTTALPNDPYNGTYARSACMQVPDMTFGDFAGSTMWNPPGQISEDCLYMNIWASVTPNQDNLFMAESSKTSPGYLGLDIGSTSNVANPNSTTLVWIYGGSYNSGTANLAVYDATALAALEGVVVMAPNYRVGPLGFLYLKNQQAPGNAGLADIALSVEWFIKYYAPLFVDTTKTPVTLFGESAGSGLIHDLLVSSKGHLFKRAIFQSLSSYLPLSFRQTMDALALTHEFAALANCTPSAISCGVSDSILQIDANRFCSSSDEINNRIAQCLLQQDAQFLTNLQFSVSYVNRYLAMQFVPTLDYQGLLSVDPSNYDFTSSAADLKKDVLAGVNEDEGTFFGLYAFLFDSAQYYNLTSFSSKFTYNNRFVADRLNEAMKTLHSDQDLNVASGASASSPYSAQQTFNQINYRKLTDCLADVYSATSSDLQPTIGFDTDLDSASNKALNSPVRAWQKLAKIMGDVTFACPLIELANKYSQKYPNNTYFYKFNKRADSNPWPAWMGVMHGYELPYVFGMPQLYPSDYSDDDRIVSRRMINYWANFARYGSL